MRPPTEARIEGFIWKLKKAVYGLEDASRYWYFEFRNTAISLGCQKSVLDPAIFFKFNNGELIGLLAVQVDDVIWSGSIVFIESVIDVIKTKFQISNEENQFFTYLGKDLSQVTETNEIY